MLLPITHYSFSWVYSLARLPRTRRSMALRRCPGLCANYRGKKLTKPLWFTYRTAFSECKSFDGLVKRSIFLNSLSINMQRFRRVICHGRLVSVKHKLLSKMKFGIVEWCATVLPLKRKFMNVDIIQCGVICLL